MGLILLSKLRGNPVAESIDMVKHKVVNSQNVSKNCLVCGVDNNFGLKTSFFETSGQELVAIFTPMDEHQSYPGVMHGGISATILDETIGRAIMMTTDEQTFGVTVELNVRYKKPVPLGGKLKVVARITNDRGRLFEGTGELYLPDGHWNFEGNRLFAEEIKVILGL